MYFKLIRDYSSIINSSLFGKLYYDDKVNHICYTLENYDKRIPEGQYTLNYTYSEKLGKYTIELLVTNRTGIRIHKANYVMQDGREILKGCIAVGMIQKKYWIENCKDAIEKVNDLFLTSLINHPDEKNYIEIVKKI